MNRPTRNQESTRAMALDAMKTLSFGELCDAIEAHTEGRPDIDPLRLHALGNAMCQMADKEQRI